VKASGARRDGAMRRHARQSGGLSIPRCGISGWIALLRDSRRQRQRRPPEKKKQAAATKSTAA